MQRSVRHMQVLYLDLKKNEGYERLVSLAGAARQHFVKAGIADGNSAQEFTPHITVAKLSKMHWRGRQSCRKIPQVHARGAPGGTDYYSEIALGQIAERRSRHQRTVHAGRVRRLGGHQCWSCGSVRPAAVPHAGVAAGRQSLA